MTYIQEEKTKGNVFTSIHFTESVLWWTFFFLMLFLTLVLTSYDTQITDPLVIRIWYSWYRFYPWFNKFFLFDIQLFFWLLLIHLFSWCFSFFFIWFMDGPALCIYISWWMSARWTEKHYVASLYVLRVCYLELLQIGTSLHGCRLVPSIWETNPRFFFFETRE